MRNWNDYRIKIQKEVDEVFDGVLARFERTAGVSRLSYFMNGAEGTTKKGRDKPSVLDELTVQRIDGYFTKKDNARRFKAIALGYAPRPEQATKELDVCCQRIHEEGGWDEIGPFEIRIGDYAYKPTDWLTQEDFEAITPLLGSDDERAALQWAVYEAEDLRQQFQHRRK